MPTFRWPFLEVEGLSLDEYPIRELNFTESEGIEIKKLLTKMKRPPSNFSEEWLESTANANVGEYMEGTFGRLAAKFARELDYGLPEVTVDDNTFFSPMGV